MITITLPVSQYTNFQDDILQAVGRGHFYDVVGSNIIQNTDDLFIQLDEVQAIVTAGGDVEGFWVGIEKATDDFGELTVAASEINTNGKYMAEILNTPSSVWADLEGLLTKDQYLALRVHGDGI